MRPSKRNRDTADSNRNIHWEKQVNNIVEVLDALGVRHQSQSASDAVERIAEAAHRSYTHMICYSLKSYTKQGAGVSDAPE